MPLILLPPSEGKAPGGDGPSWSEGTMSVDLDRQRRRVMASLRAAMRANTAARSKLLGVKGEALAAATLANRDVATAATMPAIERYTGVLYGALDAASLDAGERDRLDRQVLIVSGLWGLVGPADPIPDYKLKMGASLRGLGKLSTWWRDGIDAVLATRSPAEPVWNLLPQEHDAAWAPPSDRQVISVRFIEADRSGQLVAVSHWNKFMKGELVRHLVQHPDDEIGDLSRFEHSAGYRLDPSLTEVDGGGTRLHLVKSS